MSIPIIDISPLHILETTPESASEDPSVVAVIQQISSACQSYGFFAITNHGVSPSLISTACNESMAFFDLDKSLKEEVSMSDDYPYGYENYESLGTECANRSTDSTHVTSGIDFKETFSIGPLHESSGMPPRRLPSKRISFNAALTNYYSAMESLSQTLFRGFAVALKLDPNWFLQKGVFDTSHQCALRVLNYPALEFSDTVIRAGAHTDYGAMTILYSGGPGLQLCLSSDGRDWIDVPHLEGAFIINLGDLMQRWTNDQWRSTLHRVVAVANDECNGGDSNNALVFRSERRHSIAFFVNINGQAKVVPFESCVDENHPVRYKEILASEHLMQRHLRSMGKLN